MAETSANLVTRTMEAVSVTGAMTTLLLAGGWRPDAAFY